MGENASGGRNVARDISLGNLVRLRASGDDEKSSEERLNAYFQEEIKTEACKREFWQKYPVLWRIVHSLIHYSTEGCCECLGRVFQNRKALDACFGIKEKENLLSISWGKGDSHKRGRVVAVLRFETANLVYKPKALGLDKAYNDFIFWFSGVVEPSFSPSSYKILDCGDYGFSEFVDVGVFSSVEQVSAFYRKWGALIAIAWLFGITDLHLENVIAGQNEPFLIDVETMFDAIPEELAIEYPYDFLCKQAHNGLLFGAGLLPARRKGVSGIFDPSALGAAEDQPTPQKGKVIENEGRDDMKIVLKEGVFPKSQNLPMLEGQTQKADIYQEDIILGFDRAMKVLAENRETLLDATGPLQGFRGKPTRWVARDTESYVRLLHSLAHPTVLGNALMCDLVMGGDLWQRSEHMPFISQLIVSEIKDLWNGDVPFFLGQTDSRDLFDSFGKRYENFFHETRFDGVRKRIYEIGAHIEAQKESIWLSLKSISPVDKRQDVFEYETKNKASAPTSDALVDLACSIADSLAQRAYYVNDAPFWTGLVPLGDDEYKSSLLLPTLYEGSVGIGFFFAYLYKITKREAYKKVAQDVRNLARLVVSDDHYFPAVGAFSGLGSFLYFDLHFDAILGFPLKESRMDGRSFSKWKAAIADDKNYDIISGSAGALIVAARYFIATGDIQAEEIAKVAAQRLVETAEITDETATWDILASENYPKRLGGLAHGVSGVAWALSLWAQISGDKTVLPLVRKAFAYEQTLFDPDLGTWRDARGEALSCHWCYGAPGIAMALNEMRHVIGDGVCGELISHAQVATWKYGRSLGHGLCHGNLGNSDLYLLVGNMDRAGRILSSVLDDYYDKGYWTCDIPGPPAIPGLMCGLSGIGYMLLRHAFPNLVPSVLTLEGPKHG